MAETEALLLRRFATTGDAEALGEIIRRHAGLVYGAALRVLADMDRAADVAQDTFLQLTKDAHRVTGSLPGWLHRVATHKAIDRMRRDTSRRYREAAYAAGRSREATDWKEISPCVDEELSKLESQMRDILVAYFLEGQTTRQIALARGVSQATVSRRIDTGVTQLRAMLRKRGVLVAAGVLSLLLRQNAVQAAPAPLMAELGKVALVGGHAAAASSAGASGGQAVFTGVLASLKAKAIAVAAVVILGAGTVVTYQQATRPPDGDIVVASPVVPGTLRSASTSTASANRRSVVPAGTLEAAQDWDASKAASADPSRQPVAPTTPQSRVSQTQLATAGVPEPSVASSTPGNMMRADGSASAERDAGQQRVPVGPPVAETAIAPSGPFYADHKAPPPTEPNDSNDRKNKEEK